MSSPRKTSYRNAVIVVLLFLSVGALGALQFGLSNQGQEFGTYGQYNRVLHVIREMDEYVVVNSRLSRRLDWRNLGYLDSFSVGVRDKTGKTEIVEFLRGSPEMKERNREVLKRIIKTKFSATK